MSIDVIGDVAYGPKGWPESVRTTESRGGSVLSDKNPRLTGGMTAEDLFDVEIKKPGTVEAFRLVCGKVCNRLKQFFGDSREFAHRVYLVVAKPMDKVKLYKVENLLAYNMVWSQPATWGMRQRWIDVSEPAFYSIGEIIEKTGLEIRDVKRALKCLSWDLATRVVAPKKMQEGPLAGLGIREYACRRRLSMRGFSAVTARLGLRKAEPKEPAWGTRSNFYKNVDLRSI